ncbi:MAG: hypothetical protein EZS28_042150, partial [Streblomastix strix]
MPDTKTNRYRSQNKVAEGIRLIIQHYNLSGNSAKCRDVQNFLADFKGFDLAADGKKIAKRMNISICVYAYKEDEAAHILFISDPEALTGCRYCPICKLHGIKIKDKNCHLARDFERHVEKCKLNKGKQVLLSSSQIPFAPHIYGNQTYMYLLANEMLDKFKPTQYYITYDFETVERNINKYFGKKKDEKNEAGQQISNSFQNSILEPLRVATSIKSKSGIRTIYYDLRQENFIEQWLEEVFKAAEQIKQDNMCCDSIDDEGRHQDSEIPYEIPVPVVDWHIVQGGYLGDFSHIKRVE